MTAHLIYLVGASGSGKDSLLRYARGRLADHAGVAFAHRYITRAADAGGENHIALSTEEFAARRRAGLFALDWESHGQAYGIGVEIDQWLAQGVTVVVNGSRAYLPAAQRRYPRLLPVWIEVSTEVLRGRLQARGREDAAAIEQRLTRHRQLQAQPRTGTMIRNDGELAKAGEALVGFITQHARAAVCA
jgi:ribose 1,5-bisphosphokinase